MAKVNVPGLKASTGMKPFEPVPSGDYDVQIRALKLEPAKTGAPITCWKFETEILEGPPMPDGTKTKGRKFFFNINIMEETHPEFEKNGHIGVDELKSACLCFGVAPKGDSVDPDAFLGQQGRLSIQLKLEKDQNTGEDVKRNRVQKYVAA